MTRWRTVLSLTVAVLLALPAVAPAQNAGDQQYTDPLAPSQPRDDGGSGSSGAPPPSASGTPQAPPTTAPAQAAPAQNQLPRTGFPAGLLALAGAGMLGGGLALRRRLS